MKTWGSPKVKCVFLTESALRWSGPQSGGTWTSLLLSRALSGSRYTYHLARSHSTPAIKRTYVRDLLAYNGCFRDPRQELLTTKGCCIFSRMLFSFSMWSTCLLLMISAFFMVFIAYLSALFYLVHPTLTLPKAPTINYVGSRWGNLSSWGCPRRRTYLLLKRCRRQCQIASTQLWDSFSNLTYFLYYTSKKKRIEIFYLIYFSITVEPT